ncbi:MAG: phosphoglucosamine mutase [Alphaproteobacteria bacterium]|nr:phosphoglucosamine mutase [Alphaproteobacteria bacterium]
MGKIFGTDGIRCIVNTEPLTAETTLKISKTVGYLLKSNSKMNARVIICKDTRLSGYLYEPLITAGFISMGMEVILVGPLPTPAVPHLMQTLRADIGVMITASHNTYEYNGIKFFNIDGFKISSKLEKEVENIVLNKKKYSKILNTTSITGKAVRLEDASGRYSEFLKSTLNKKIKTKKLKIVLDCGNGATYDIAPNIFWELGHNVVSINNRPDGKNINYNCGAVNVANLCKKVVEEKADIGFAFDGDGDRLIVVDDKGNEIDGDKIIALFAKYLINNKKTNSKFPVIATVMSNLGLENFLLKDLGIKLKRSAVGDINVIEEMKKNKSSLGGEQSGHIILSDFSKTGDGILAALKITEIMLIIKKSSSSIFDLYDNLPQIKVNISYKKISEKTKKNIKDLNKKNSRDKKIRVLIRLSGTEPLIRLLVEGQDLKIVQQKAKNLELEIRNIIGQ